MNNMHIALAIAGVIAVLYIVFLVLFRRYAESNPVSKAAAAGLVVGIACFLNLLGIEKALAAITIGLMGLNEAGVEAKQGKGIAYAAIALGSLYLLAITVLLIVKGPDFITHMRMMTGK